MTKEQIIEILQKYELKTMGIIVTTHLEEIADEIFELRVDVPDDEEIKNYFTKEHYHYEKGRYTKVDKDRIYGAKWMKDEIIKRNK